ncbi:Uncharacterised protein [Chlamydia abortus]|uniref:Uncharacterized protein n=1 Tax=Chlamydia abortus (strain DSM 27085 / S26/3) TaxID=218497 RepID=Q5L5P9_CHLAB|nr:conserved hypothetical protein [Chlamydia abortus S26/3]CED80645.1 conserved hypothetical protein [Chlamydia abortus]CED81605.1 conserved hypothetical protein [Chlamydia abortus]CEF17051.1 conserved hypothetical protein [Chlamydia abortus]SFW03290.1 Uncharacterised protein [Chlamydia abortus]
MLQRNTYRGIQSKQSLGESQILPLIEKRDFFRTVYSLFYHQPFVESWQKGDILSYQLTNIRFNTIADQASPTRDEAMVITPQYALVPPTEQLMLATMIDTIAMMATSAAIATRLYWGINALVY